MSGLSSISNALFVSGGVNEQGSLRNIQLKGMMKLLEHMISMNFYSKDRLIEL